MDVKLLQANLNHCKGAQLLLQHYMGEAQKGLCCVSEPWFVPNDPRWFASEGGRAAILINPDALDGVCALVKATEDFVMVRYKGLFIISVYLSPNAGIEAFGNSLENLGGCVAATQGEIIIGGDFNAKSRVWGYNATNRRVMLLDWAAERDLRLLNVGDEPTCTRPQGTSVVDLTWANLHEGSAIVGWTVLGVETMSDHQYIAFDYTGERGRSLSESGRYPRWNLDCLDEDLLKAILELECAGAWGRDLSADQLAGRLNSAMIDGYDLAARRVGRRPPKRAAYWWSAGISVLRAMCTRSRRRLTRLRRRGPSQRRDSAEAEYRTAKRALKAAIKEAKGKAWKELIKTIEEDPWRLPYRLVLNRLRRASPD